MMLEFNDVCFRYDNQSQYILQNLNFKVENQEFIAIIGKSGSGKTTIMKLITLQLEHFTGKISVLGYDLPIQNKDKHAYIDQISVVLQRGALFRDMTVYENIAFPLSQKKVKNIKELVYEQMAEWQLDYIYAEYYPYQLSGGMMQKVAIARSNIIKKPLVVYDEPCAGLDPDSSLHITGLMYKQHLQYNQTVLLITHNVNLAYQFADKIMPLANGKISAEHVNSNK